VDLLLQGAGLFPGLRQHLGVGPFLGQVDHDLQVLQTALVAVQLLDRGLELRDLPGDAPGPLLIVPEVGCGDLVLQRRNLLKSPVEVKETS